MAKAPEDRYTPALLASDVYFNCDKVGHFAADCPRPNKAMTTLEQSEQKLLMIIRNKMINWMVRMKCLHPKKMGTTLKSHTRIMMWRRWK